jgi:hypothetical protein
MCFDLSQEVEGEVGNDAAMAAGSPFQFSQSHSCWLQCLALLPKDSRYQQRWRVLSCGWRLLVIPSVGGRDCGDGFGLRRGWKGCGRGDGDCGGDVVLRLNGGVCKLI